VGGLKPILSATN